MQEWAIHTTLDNGWATHQFNQFISNADQSEFLRSQIPFFYAVQAFPQALSKLASQIETSEQRWLVIENLYEEHGQGNFKKFHTSTFKEFLTVLGWNQELYRNPWVTEWVDNVLSKDLSAGEYAAYLAGIEFAYAPISKTIADHMNHLGLITKQNHYGNHADLDWLHGAELLDVALSLSESYDKLQDVFKQAQYEFLDLYSHLIIPTAFEMKEINKEDISFYYTREDSGPEIFAVSNAINSGVSKPSILMIGSGGETLIDLLSIPRPLNIDVIDMNSHQLELCKFKISQLLSFDTYSNIDTHFSGKFEKIFSRIREIFNYQGEDKLSTYIATSSQGQQKLKYIVNNLFSNENLAHVFSDRATKFSSESFADHFYNVFVKACQNFRQSRSTAKNIFNIIDGEDITLSKHMLDAFNLYYHNHYVTYTLGNFESLKSNEKYDIVSISNIGDWMPIEQYKELLASVREKLKPNGVVVARKLLGDYSLEQILRENSFKCRNITDNTFFYSEVCLGSFAGRSGN